MENIKEKCRKLLEKYQELTTKEKRNFISLFSSLIEENKEEAKQLYFDFEYLFQIESGLELCKEGLIEVFGELKEPKTTLDKSEKPCLKEAREQFNLDGNIIDKATKEIIRNKTYYQRKTEFLNVFDEKKTVNLLILGETGSGKTTLINSMTNYLTGIQYDDNIRLVLIRERIKSQSESQTEEITMYAIKPKENIFNKPIRFIDTPGFGDTEGRDEGITEKIQDFIKTKSPRLNGICFVMKSSNNRVTPTQKYIINKLLSLFGRDTKKNFFGLFTFADSSTPEAIEVIKTENIPISKENIFCFNNSGILSKRDIKNYSPEIEKQFFDLGYESFKQFFDRIRQVTAVDLNQTKEVIKSRKEIENRLNNLLININNAISRQTTIENLLREYEENEENILANKDFEYEVEEAYEDREQVKPGTYVTVCPKCNYHLCHNDCSYADNDDKWLCSSMNHKGAFENYKNILKFNDKYYLYYGDTIFSGCKNLEESYIKLESEEKAKFKEAKKKGKVKEITKKMIEKIKCDSCKGRCSWKDHRNLGYYYVTGKRKVKKEYKQKKDKFIEGRNKEKELEVTLLKMEEEMTKEENEIKCDREEILNNLRILDEIALRPEKRDDKSVVMDYYELQLDVAIKENNEKRKRDLKKIIEKEREFIKIKNTGEDSYTAERDKLKVKLRKALNK